MASNFSLASTCDLKDSSVEILKSRTRSGSLAGDIFEDLNAVPRRKKTNLDDYAVINISPSIIPTYFPAVRLFT